LYRYVQSIKAVQALLGHQHSSQPRLKAMPASRCLHYLALLLGGTPLDHNGPTPTLYRSALLLHVGCSGRNFVRELEHLTKARFNTKTKEFNEGCQVFSLSFFYISQLSLPCCLKGSAFEN